ncbi:glycosyltransferase family 4 protein [Novosphingobium ginsenosidimutans]|uniref:Glycosyltransferase family 4 protein n=1 Tax=Novosphingobium ginsenosidimutans TaxID=1176536 RepID=A0A5B8SAL2_9SPHN|nr:glycosyltransferase [Novosphingobium ginsenosidimutans]QEA17582.1 glycosyltransferase family 4 protein [Novosphingobium ginsenosidimutans]
MRVLSISTLYPNEHTPNFGVFVERQMQAVAKRGDVDLTLVNPIGLPPFPLSLHPRYRQLRDLPEREHRSGVNVLRPRFSLLPMVGARFNAGAIVRAVLPLVRRLHAEQKFNLVDAQFFHPDGYAAVRIAAVLGLPVSIKARGADIQHWGRQRATAAQVRKAGRRATGLLAVSNGLIDDMTALGMPREKITLHRTGLDADLFRPYDRRLCRDQLGLPRDKPVLATVGALIPRKGQRYAIEALAKLPGAILLIAGKGDDEAMLHRLAAQLGVAERVRFLGAVPHAELPVLLNAADVLVLPSSSEGLANAWVEALACGTPVVTTPIPGAQELITDPDWGRLVPRDGSAIAAAVSALLAERSSPERVQEAVAGMSWQANAAALVEHWRRLAGA